MPWGLEELEEISDNHLQCNDIQQFFPNFIVDAAMHYLVQE